MQPTKTDKKISPLYPLAWCAFLLVPAFAFYTGWQHHSLWAMIISALAMSGFITLIVIAVRHNRKLASGSTRG
ncbi:MAG TPA: hypothetical protein VFX43_06405 [Chitinophagaceae bacterium]|jgi:hypothetical protein|nr:hypothetical protein [Chitinophagaceae bacterium]